MECWASAVSPCGGKQSDEHPLSYGLFLSATTTVKGGPFSKETLLPIKSLVTKCLCEEHNRALSDLDVASADLVNCLRALDEIRAVRAKVAKVKWKFPGPSPFRLGLSGVLLERWFAKLTLGGAHFFPDVLKIWSPPPWLARFAFGKAKLPPGAGLAMLARVGDTIANTEHLQIVFGGRPKDAGPTALLFSARGGFRFFFSWELPITAFAGANVHGTVYAAADSLLAHPKRVEFSEGNCKLNLSLDLDWSDPPRAAHTEVVRLRKKYRAPARSQRAARRRTAAPST